METNSSENVLGEELHSCSDNPTTGFYRDGCCHTGPRDLGNHVVCAEMTEAFLQFTAKQGNDLTTPRPEMNFPGLDPGDRWCLCAGRWMEAVQAGVAPPVVLEATNKAALDVIALETLRAHAIDSAASSEDDSTPGTAT